MRVVRTPEGAVCLDRDSRRAAGRGAYLCPDARCLRKAQRALQRALSTPVPAELLDEIERQARELREAAERESGETDD